MGGIFMLFHITNRHNYETCGGTTGKSLTPEYNRWIEGNDKVKVLGVWPYNPMHTIFAVVESEDYQAVLDLTSDARKSGTSEIVPVVDGFERRQAQGFWGK
tara:strand:+ start:263 stop:565 length:303 start_codon:yes stop_codon:yes gene_type:complete